VGFSSNPLSAQAETSRNHSRNSPLPALSALCRVLLDLPPCLLIQRVRSHRRERKKPARGRDVVESDEQLEQSEIPDCRSGQTGHVSSTCLWRTLLVVLSFLAPLAQAAETNLLPASPVPVIRRPTPNPQDIAAANEWAGRIHEAAALYETMARTNASARKVLSHRLVAIYAQTGETNKALTWAREVMRDNPDPQAYLAAVHAQVGQSREARAILELEIAGNTNSTRAVTLRWQLAEVYSQEGDEAKARRILIEAAGMAKGTPVEAAAQRRLNALKKTEK
jgi:tetratricopeptide (TPR) repeat protein